jgi:hypothetical protein
LDLSEENINFLELERFQPNEKTRFSYFSRLCVSSLGYGSQIVQCGRVLGEKLKAPELLKTFSPFYGTRKFITILSREWSLS